LAPRLASKSYVLQWVVASSPLRRPAAARRREPVHTDVVYKLVSCTLSSHHHPEYKTHHQITPVLDHMDIAESLASQSLQSKEKQRASVALKYSYPFDQTIKT